MIDGRQVRYRFAKQKARYLSAALKQLSAERPPLSSGKELRDWLLVIPGIGYKTASWVARNWLDADDVAILDIHILRAGLLGKFFESSLTVERNYLELEEQFIRFSKGLGVRASELDALMWLEMMSSPPRCIASWAWATIILIQLLAADPRSARPTPASLP